VNTLQSTLRAQPTVSRKSRGRREGRNSHLIGDVSEFGGMSSSTPSTAPPTSQVPQTSLSPISPALASPTLSPIRLADSDTHSLASIRTASRSSGIALHPDLETPGFNISILETLSAIISNGTIQKTFIMGEIALSNHGHRSHGIQISNVDRLEQIISNKAVLNDSGNGAYALTTDQLPSKGAIALKYKVGVPHDPQTVVPLLIRTMWKVEHGSISLMVGYQSNPAFPGSPNLSHVMISATVPADARVQTCQSKPVGQFSRDRGQLIWHVPSVLPHEQTLLAKFSTDGSAPRTGTIEAKWECRGVIVSGIDVSGIPAKNPFADDVEVAWKANVRKGLISGKYSCQS
jgi:F-BAR domain only protein